MAMITQVSSLLTGAVPVAPSRRCEKRPARRYRPSIDIERVRRSWNRAYQHFSAIQAGDADSLLASYDHGAVMYHSLLGKLSGSEIDLAISGFRRQTRSHAFVFHVERAGVDAAEISWTWSHDFLPTGRAVEIEGMTRLLFAPRGIQQQFETINLRDWSRQAFGLKGAVLSLLPGWRVFVEAELRRAFGMDLADA